MALPMAEQFFGMSVFFLKYISFYVVKISSVFCSVLIIQLFCSASLCELAETGQWKTFGSSFTV